MTPFDIQTSSSSIDLKNIYKKSDIYVYSYARYAFFEVLEKMDITSIYLPSFICRDILSPINILDIKYFFYDVNEKLEPILEDVKCDVILMVNYFGFVQDIKPFQEYKEKYNSIIIEDNAHGFLSCDEFENQLGSRGDFGLLSIRKTIALPNGAALLINNDEYKNIKFGKIASQLSFEDEKYNKKHFLKKLFISKYFGIAFLLFRRILRYIKTGSSIPMPDNESEKILPSNKFITPKLENLTLNITKDLEINRRRNMYLQVMAWAKTFDIKPICELEEGIVPFEFAFIDNGKYKQFEKYLFLKGYFILPWPDLPDEVISTCPEFYKDIKVVPFLW
jgi:hypothetical protein